MQAENERWKLKLDVRCSTVLVIYKILLSCNSNLKKKRAKIFEFDSDKFNKVYCITRKGLVKYKVHLRSLFNTFYPFLKKPPTILRIYSFSSFIKSNRFLYILSRITLKQLSSFVYIHCIKKRSRDISNSISSSE